MKSQRIAAAIMTGISLAEAAPLIATAFRPGGIAQLGRWLGWHAPHIPPRAWLLSAAIAAAYAALSMRSLPFIRQHATTITPLKILAIPFALITGTFEELFFRKSLMDHLQAHAFSTATQIAASALIFGLAHAIWGLLARNLRAAALAMLYTSALGLALAATYLLSNRQPAPAAWSHIAINLIIEPWLILAVMKLRPQAE